MRTGSQGIAFAGMLVTCTACSTLSITPPPPLAQDGQVAPAADSTVVAAKGIDPYIVFNRALAKAQDPGAAGDAQLNLLNQGFALVNYRCNQYFNLLGKAEQNLRYTRKQTSLTSGTVLAMLGLANASTKAVANTGSVFSYGVASMDSYEDVYIFSPEVKAVQNLVLDALSAYQKKFKADTEDPTALTYTGVVSALSEYEAICQPHGVRDLVNQSLAQVKTTGNGTTAEPVAPAASAASAPAAAAANAPASGAAAASQRLLILPRVDVRVVPRTVPEQPPKK